MNICDDGHDQVVYEGRECPVCEKIKEVDRLDSLVDDLRVQLHESSSEISDLKTQIAQLS